MRIRTLKPEFWTHETMANLPDFTRLVAIALLNYADDEGYFFANAVLIRGAIFPFVDESGRIRGAVGELSRVGYLELGIDNQGHEVGRIVSFSKHQKGDKLKPSKLKDLCTFPDSSPTNPLPVPEASPLEQGTGNREQVAGNREVTPEPDALDLSRDPNHPTLDQWMTRAPETVCDWSRQWWERKWYYYDKIGWIAGQKPIKNWKTHQDSCVQWFRQDRHERKQNAPPSLEQIAAAEAAQKAEERRQQLELQEALKADRE